MNLTVITPTCSRPEAFTLCERWMARQTVQPFQWLVLDDDATPTKCTAGQEYHHWPECRGRGSLVKKIGRALRDGLVKGDAIVFVENDDYYASDWLDFCVQGLKRHSLFGEGRALYYTVRGRFWFEHVNLHHASLCSTAIRRDMFPWLLKQCDVSQEPFLDVRLWNKATAPNQPHVFDPYREGDGRRRTIGIKAMPGTSGYGGGHRGRDRSAVDDLDLSKLRELIGDDADAYASFYEPGAFPPPPEPKAVQTPLNARTAPVDINSHTHIARSECGRVHGPNWLKWLMHLRGKPATGMEIGTFEGDSAEWMADNIFCHPASSYHCVDPFTGSIEHKTHGVKTDHLEKTARAKLSRFDNVEIHKGYSQTVVRQFTGKLDFCYIDGDHSTRGALRDAVLVFDVLKVGGIAVFDDYTWSAMPNTLDRPKSGIDAFLACYARHLKLLHKGYQVAIQKTSE